MITGKNIVLTGGTSGIGKAVLDLLAVEKSNRIVVAARSAAKLTGYGENVFPFPCDISTREGVDSLFEAMEAQLGKADIFIANAGAPYYEVYDYTNWDRVDAIFRLNAMSPMYTYTKFLHHLDGREGTLVYTISAMGEMAIPGYALYTATKFAMKGFQQAIRLEKPKNLKLTCVYPVATKTNFFNVGGGGIDVGQPFPVQSAEVVAKAMIRAIERGKKNLYPCPIYLPSRTLMNLLPLTRSIYWKIESNRLDRFLELSKKAEQIKSNKYSL